MPTGIQPPGLNTIRQLGVPQRGLPPAGIDRERMDDSLYSLKALASPETLKDLGRAVTGASENPAAQWLTLPAMMNPMMGGSGPKWMRNPSQVRQSVTPAMLAEALTGNEVARAHVVDGLQNMVAKTAGRFVKPGRPTAEREDLMAEGNHAILEVLNKGKAMELPQFLGYVKGAIENRINWFSRGQQNVMKRGAPLESAPSMEDIRSRIPDIPRQQMNDILNQSMAKLSPKQRETVELRLGLTARLPEGGTTDKIAELQGIARQNVEKNLKAGLGKLKKHLQSQGIEASDLVPETEMPPPSRSMKPPVSGGNVLPPKPPMLAPTPTPMPPPISGGSGLPSDPKGLISKLGLQYEGATPGLKPEDPSMHWWTELLPGGEKGTTGLVQNQDDWDKLIARFQKPIGGGSQPELSALGKELARRTPEMSSAGGSSGLARNVSQEPYEASWPSSAAATADAADSMNLGSVPGSRALDLRNNPDAIKQFLEMLDQYHGGQY